MKRLLVLTAICSLFNSYSSWGGEKEYHCTTKSVSKLTSDGILKSYSSPSLLTTFIVDKNSGLIKGYWINNEAWVTRTIIDSGSSEQSFKLLTLSADVSRTNGGKLAMYLQVKEYAETLEKPFMHTDGSIVRTGVCT
jgi:hypothetical protein